MDRAQFTEKHGAIKLAKAADRYFAKLRQPQPKDGYWDVTGGVGPKILNGHFYTIGYFRADQNPLEQEHDWAALDTARRLTTSWVRKLRSGKCYALQSEGDGLYFAFICAANPLDAAALGATLADDVRQAYAQGAIRGTYDASVTTIDRSGQACLFWGNSEDDYYAEELEDAAYSQYRAVSDRMLAVIDHPVEIKVYSDFVEFPVIYGGSTQDGLFIGVITSCVWT
jgi:hypothetical protein